VSNYKKILNNNNAIELDGKVILRFDPRYKDYLEWKAENPDLEKKLVDEMEKEQVIKLEEAKENTVQGRAQNYKLGRHDASSAAPDDYDTEAVPVSVHGLDALADVRDDLNKVGPGFCLAKWTQVTILLQTGQTHSCHHPRPHKIPLHEIKDNPSALHNTVYKKLQRKSMLKGGRPPECDYCWNVEDANPNAFSDRTMKSGEGWSYPHFGDIKKSTGDENIQPTYVEISFSNQCNMACAYCDVKSSSRWQSEIASKGYYPTSGQYNNTTWMRREGTIPIPHTQPNPYRDAFWKWWPDLFPSLHTFRITGGEPLLQKDTFKVLDYIIKNPTVNPNIELGINSNLSIPDEQWDEFLYKVKYITENNLVKNFVLFTSTEAWGEQAEYIRDGMDSKILWKRVEEFLKKCEKPEVTIMAAFNALSVTTYRKVIEKVYRLKKTYHSDKRYRDYSIILDTSYVRHPEFLDYRILTDDWLEKISDMAVLMEDLGMHQFDKAVDAHSAVGWFDFEQEKVRRMSDMTPPDDEWVNKQRKDFYLFITEYDKRREKNFLETFPEMEDFYNICKKIKEFNYSITGTWGGDGHMDESGLWKKEE
tara:strand:- start:196 stop:1965 length:1770 start_codon:yes stop_codon:yes gene_type:complete